MRTPIPGSTALGHGFNALGAYKETSLMSRLFVESFSDNKTHLYQPTKLEYAVPNNVDVMPFAPRRGETKVFESQQDVREYFQLMAGLSVGGGAFGGQINASFNEALEEWGSCFYALTNAWIGTWRLQLNNTGPKLLLPEIEAEINSLPETFSPATAEAFFEFFLRYGTHYVRSVGVGGYFCYNLAVQNIGEYSHHQVEANIALEYKAVWIDGRAESQLDWHRLSSKWAATRHVRIDAIGGSAESLRNTVPVFGTNESSGYTKWLTTIEQSPSIVEFALGGWADLVALNSPKRTALQEASKSLLNHNVNAKAFGAGSSNSTAGDARIAVEGKTIAPALSWPDPLPTDNPTWFRKSGLHLVLVDKDTLKSTFSGFYYFDWHDKVNQALFDRLMSDISTATTLNQYCVLSVFNCLWVIPDKRFLLWLRQFSIFLQKWVNGLRLSGSDAGFNYVAIGYQGAFRAVESFSIVSTQVNVLETELQLNLFTATKMNSAGALADIASRK